MTAAADTSLAARQLAEFSGWIDEAVTGTEKEWLWGRTAKVAEEYGEVVAAIIGYLGENPRKGVTHTRDDIAGELLDAAMTALAATPRRDGER